MAESKEELKSLLMKKEESEKWSWNSILKAKTNKITKAKIKVSSSITSWQMEGGKVEVVQILFSWAPKSL